MSVLVHSGCGVIRPAYPPPLLPSLIVSPLAAFCLEAFHALTSRMYCVYIYDVYLNQNVKLLFKLSFVHFGHVLLLHWFSMNIL